MVLTIGKNYDTIYSFLVNQFTHKGAIKMKRSELITQMTEKANALAARFPADAANGEGETYVEIIAEKLAKGADMANDKFCHPDRALNHFNNELATVERIGNRKGLLK